MERVSGREKDGKNELEWEKIKERKKGGSTDLKQKKETIWIKCKNIE